NLSGSSATPSRDNSSYNTTLRMHTPPVERAVTDSDGSIRRNSSAPSELRSTRSLASESAKATIPPWIRRRDSGQTRRPPRVVGAGAEAAFVAASDAACHRYDLEVPRMNRQNLFSDAWDGENEEAATRHRIFWRPDDARMGATLYELALDAPETQ